MMNKLKRQLALLLTYFWSEEKAREKHCEFIQKVKLLRQRITAAIRGKELLQAMQDRHSKVVTLPDDGGSINNYGKHLEVIRESIDRLIDDCIHELELLCKCGVLNAPKEEWYRGVLASHLLKMKAGTQ